MKVYRLLRNNQETGPFTAEEVLQKGLKPYDLIWVDGKSAAWRYPSEIDVFKAYVVPVEEQPYDRFYKKEEAAVDKAQPAKPIVKPKFRIRADSHKIELVEPEVTPASTYKETVPAKSISHVAETPATPVSTPAWQDALNDWQSEQPELPTVKQEKKPSRKESAIQFPLSSPDELDESYTDNIFKQKQYGNKGRQILSYAVLAILAPLLIAGMWFGFRQNNAVEQPENETSVSESKNQDKNASPSVSKENNPLIEVKKEASAPVAESNKVTPAPPVHTANVPVENHNANATVATKKAVTSTVVANTNLPAKTATKVPATVITNSTPVATQQPAATLKKATATQPQTVAVAPVAGNVKAKEQSQVPASNGNNAAVQTATTTAATNPPPVVSNKKISSYVDVQQENLPAAPGEKSVRFHVKNLGDAQVDLVVLDLQYFDGRGKLRKGSTMYFKKIPAQNDIAVDAPIVKDADRVSYKVSLLSIEQKGVYIIAE